MIKKWLNRVLCTISGLTWVLLLAAMLLLNSMFFIVEVISGSMEPAIMTGERVLAVKTKAEDCKVGDIVVYDVSKDIRIIHRVTSTGISILNGEHYAYVTTKGDANEYSDTIMVTDTHNLKKVVRTDLKVIDTYMEHKVTFSIGVIACLLYLPMSIVLALDAETSKEEVKKLLEKNKKKQRELEGSALGELTDVEVGLEETYDGENNSDGCTEVQSEAVSTESTQECPTADEQATVRYYCDLEGTPECIGGAGGCDDCTIKMEKELQDSIEGREGAEQNGRTEDCGAVDSEEVTLEEIRDSVDTMTEMFCAYQYELEAKRRAENEPVRRAIRVVGALSIITTSVVGAITIMKAFRK